MDSQCKKDIYIYIYIYIYILKREKKKERNGGDRDRWWSWASQWKETTLQVVDYLHDTITCLLLTRYQYFIFYRFKSYGIRWISWHHQGTEFSCHRDDFTCRKQPLLRFTLCSSSVQDPEEQGEILEKDVACDFVKCQFFKAVSKVSTFPEEPPENQHGQHPSTTVPLYHYTIYCTIHPYYHYTL